MKAPLLQLFSLSLSLYCGLNVMAEENIGNLSHVMTVNDKGQLNQIQLAEQILPFANNEKGGPSFYLCQGGKEIKAD